MELLDEEHEEFVDDKTDDLKSYRGSSRKSFDETIWSICFIFQGQPCRIAH